MDIRSHVDEVVRDMGETLGDDVSLEVLRADASRIIVRYVEAETRSCAACVMEPDELCDFLSEAIRAQLPGAPAVELEIGGPPAIAG